MVTTENEVLKLNLGWKKDLSKLIWLLIARGSVIIIDNINLRAIKIIGPVFNLKDSLEANEAT